MHRKRALSLAMIRSLNERLGIPAEVLIRPIRSGRRGHAA
jgi:antitoxin component HigA of HigAB toxin-antitoxin module